MGRERFMQWLYHMAGNMQKRDMTCQMDQGRMDAVEAMEVGEMHSKRKGMVVPWGMLIFVAMAAMAGMSSLYAMIARKKRMVQGRI